MADKPAVLQDQKFTVDEGWLYRFFRGGSIQLNKLMFGSLILLAIWLLWALVADSRGCVEVAKLVETPNGTIDDGTRQSCSVWLSETTTFLSSMAILSFIASMIFGLFGLMVGKRIVAMTPSQEEVGAGDSGEEE